MQKNRIWESASHGSDEERMTHLFAQLRVAWRPLGFSGGYRRLMNGKPRAQEYSLNACYDKRYHHRLLESQTNFSLNGWFRLKLKSYNHLLTLMSLQTKFLWCISGLFVAWKLQFLAIVISWKRLTSTYFKRAWEWVITEFLFLAELFL